MRLSDQASSMVAKRKKAQYVSMEGIRGIAALLVAVRHMKPIMTPFTSQSSFLAVDIFFMLSGFVLAFSYDQRLRDATLGFFELSVLRVIRIYPLFILGSIIGAIVILTSIGPSWNLCLLILKTTFLIPSVDGVNQFYALDYPTWSLFFEMAYSFVYAGILFRLSDKTIAVIAALSAIFFFWGIVKHGGADIGYQPEYFAYGFARIGYSFSIGILIFRKRDTLSRLLPRMGNRAVLLIFAATTLALILPVRHQSVSGALFDIVSLCVVFPVIIVAATQAKPSGIVEAAALVLGMLSFPLYVFHVPLSAMTIELFRRFAGVELAALAPWSGVVVLGGICIVSILADRYVDIPIRRRLRAGLFRKRDIDREVRNTRHRAPRVDKPLA